MALVFAVLLLPGALAIRATDLGLSDTGGLACYCKQVASVADCPNNDDEDSFLKPSGPHMFHDGRCCNLDTAAGMSGWALSHSFTWTKQPTLQPCFSEEAVIPSTSCCVLDDAVGIVGVRVSRAIAKLFFRSPTKSLEWHDGSEFNQDVDEQFRKSKAMVALDDVIDSSDFDGTAVGREDTQAFLRALMDSGRLGNHDGRIICRNNLRDLQTKPTRCALRAKAAQECCCKAPEVEEVFRCLPPDGAAPQPLQPVALETLTASVQTLELDGLQHTELVSPQPSEPPSADRLDRTDPEQPGRTWAWDRSPEQWDRTRCLEHQQLPVVESYLGCPKESDTKVPPCKFTKWECKMVFRGTEGRGGGLREECQSVTRWPNPEEKPRQASKDFCLSQEWARKCPAGTVQYQRVIPQGTCMGEKSGLLSVGPLMYSCPEGHVSSKQGSRSPFSPRCKCADVCLIV